MKQIQSISFIFFSFLIFNFTLFALDNKRPEKWAMPLNKPGLHNFFKVSDVLYRGAKPDLEGIDELKKLGIKTIVNLEVFHSDRSKIKKAKAGIAYQHIFVNTLKMKDEQIIQFLKIVTNKDKTPVFLHCYHGSDRTGTFTAAYRIIVQGWSKQDAIDELKNGGYGYHKMFSNLITYLNEMDVDRIKKQVFETSK